MSVGVHDETIPLQPVRRFWLRLVLVVVPVAVLWVTGYKLHTKVGNTVLLVLWLGSFPQPRIAGDRFERAFLIAFLPLRVKRWPLDRFTRIEIEGVERDEIVDMAFSAFRWFRWVFRLFDYAIPWLGGDYKIWLRAASGKRVLAWQGNGDAAFRANMELLQARTGVPIERK